MQITRTKKALVAVIALVLVGIFVAVAAVYLPSAENSSAFKDNTVADSGSGADTVSTVSASSTAPSEDGTVPEGYQTTCTDEITSIEDIRGTSGSYYLTGNIDVLSLDTSGKTFSGTLDGNGKTITIRATALNQENVLTVGGLFSVLSGTVKNLNIVVETFSFSTSSSGQRNIGIIAGTLSGGTVDNVKIELKYSPSGNDPSQGIGNVQAYFFDSGQHSGESLDTFFGGVAGSSVGGTIKNTTVHNATSGNYGVSIVTANKKPMFESASSDNAVGLFIGCATSGTTNLTNIRVIENSDSKIGSYFYQASHDKRSLIGVVWGWGWSESTVNIDGIIYDNTIDFKRYTNYAGNQGIGTQHAGSMNGWHEGGISVKNVFAPEEMTWLDGADDTIRGTIYTEDKVVAFDDNNTDNVIVKATFANPTEEAITSSVTVGNSTTSVLQALTVGDGETAGGTTAYVSVKKSTANLNGTNYNITYGNANKGTMNLGGASFTENRDEGYYSAREYDGNAEAARSISLSTGKTIENVYIDNSGLGKNVGLHTLAYNAEALEDSYKVVKYNGVSYIVGDDGYVYTPDNISINGEQSVIDVTKNQIVEITQRAITLGNDNGNVTYGDTLETVQLNNIPVATQGSIVAGEYVESCTVDGYVQFAANAGEETAFGYTGAIIKDADGNDVTGNYNISFAEGKAVVKQKAVEGILSADDLVYNATAKTAKFSLTGGELYNDDAVSIAYSGDQINVTTEGFIATATLPSNNYTFGGENGNAISQTFYISPKTVEITKNESATTVYDYSGVVPNEVLLTLFNVPKDVDGGDLFLNFAATYNGEEATVQYAGTYTVTATLAAEYMNDEGETVSQANYTAAPCEASITIKAKDIHVSINEEVADSKVYDGKVVGEDYLLGMFAVDGTLDEGGVPELTLSVAEGEVLNAGVYNLSVSLHPDYNKMYAISATSVTTAVYTVNKVDVEITGTEYSGQSFNNQEFTDYASLFNAPNEIDGATPLALEYSVAKGGEAATIFNVGTYTVTAKLAENDINGNYNAVPFERTYEVEPWEVEIVWSANEYTYTGDVQAVSAKYTDWDSNEIQLAVSFGDGVEFRNAGEYTATASFAEGDNTLGNYALPATSTKTYNIKKADSVINTEGVVKEYTYTGELQTVNGGATLNHSEAELVYSDNTFTTVAEGNGMEVVISVADSANYNGTSTTVQITVNKATPVVKASVAEGQLFENGELPEITAVTDVEGNIAWDADQTLTAGEKSYTWTFTPVDTDNYNVATGSETLNVAAVEMTGIEIKTQPSKVNYEYGDKFDKTGMVVEAVYNDGSRTAVEDYTVDDAYLTTLGENQITVTYNEKTATVDINIEAKKFEIAYSDLTVVAGTAAFDLASITASIVGTESNTVNVAGNDYTYSVAVDYTGAQYDAGAEVGTEYPLTVTVTVTDLDAQYYVGTYEATLRVIATSMEGSWVSESVTAEYDGTAHAAEFNKTVGGEFEIQYAVSGTDVWSTEVPVNAGEYVAKVVSLNDGYSADRLPTATVTINKKSVEISAVNGTVSADYNGTAFADYASLFNAPSGVNDEGALELTYTVTKDGEPAEILGAGTYTVTATLANVDGNYTAAACEVTYTVAPAEITVNRTGSSSVVYSGKAYEPTFEATGLVGNDKISLTYEASEGALTDGKARNAGSYTATAVLPNANYVFAAETRTTFDFAIEKVKVSYSALLDGNTKYVEYGGEYTPSVDDFYTTSVANSELFEFYIRWSLEFDLSGIATANAGKKYEAAVEGVVRYAGGEDIAEADYCNFELTGYIADIVVYVEVIAKKINVTATDASAKYDGEKVSVDELLAMFGLGGIDANVTVGGEAYDFADIKNVGTYNVVVASANGNYEFIGDTDATFTVNAADMTDVIVTGYNDEYDKAAHNAVANATATTVDGIEVTFTYATSEDGVYGDAPEYTDAGTYTVYYKAVAANHNEAMGSFTVTIEKADYDMSGVKFEDTTLVYNGSVQSISATDLPEGLTAMYSEGIKDVGSVVITVTFATDDGNYNVPDPMQATLTISPKSLTVKGTFTAQDREYDGSQYVDLVGRNYSLQGVVGSDDVKLFSYSGVMNDKNVGENKTVNIIVQIVGADSKNYTVVQPASITVNITPAELAVTWGDTVEFDYDGSAHAPTASVPTGVLGEVVEITVIGAQTDAGDYTATATTDNGNYTLTNATKDFKINKIASVIDISGVIKDYVYNGVLQTVTGATLNHSEAELTYSNNTFTTVAEGNGMTVTVSVKESKNYLAASESFDINVSAKQIAVVWGELTLEYDGTAQAPTATADTGIDGETVSIAVSGAATEPGTYTATATTDNGNYTLTNASVEYEIVKTAVAAQFTVGYGVITVVIDGDNDVEYSVDGGEWATLPDDGKISVNLEASWTIRLRYVGETAEVEHVVYTSANNVLILLEENLDSDALLNKDVIDTAKSWLATAVGDKTEAQAKLTEAENAYNAAKDALAGSVENAFKATANITDRAVAATVAIATAVTGLGLAAGAIAIRRKGGKKNEK